MKIRIDEEYLNSASTDKQVNKKKDAVAIKEACLDSMKDKGTIEVIIAGIPKEFVVETVNTDYDTGLVSDSIKLTELEELEKAIEK